MQHPAHTFIRARQKEEIAMQSIIALKQPLKHYLSVLVVLLVFTTGFMFAVVETMSWRNILEIPEIQKSVTVSTVEVARNIAPLP
jgi:hypothetical protein